MDASIAFVGDRVGNHAGIWVVGLGGETLPPYPQFVFRRVARQVPPLAGLSVGNGVEAFACPAEERCDAVREQSFEGIRKHIPFIKLGSRSWQPITNKGTRSLRR